MRILFLGYDDCLVLDYLRQRATVYQTSEKIDAELASNYDYLVSYGYRHILKRDVLSLFNSDSVCRGVNLHISYLPYNRGADPNFWSFIESSPKGVTIHCLDEGIDTGDILAQELVPVHPEDTLRSSYERLQFAMQRLFIQTWPAIERGAPLRIPQGDGTHHFAKDKKEKYSDIPLSTKVTDLPLYIIQK